MTKQYAGIDFFRLFASFIVVAIHTSPFSVWNDTLDLIVTYSLGRVAVPFFFMTTGYFILAPYAQKQFQKKERFYKFLRKSGFLYLAATFLYLPVSLYAGKLPHHLRGWIKTICFDGTFYHLWYFPAVMIGCILLIPLIKKSRKAAFISAAAAYLIGLAGDSYYGLLKYIPFLQAQYEKLFSISSYTRNGLFFAPLFLMLGISAATPRIQCSRKKCILDLAVSSGLLALEGLITAALHLQKHNSMYLFLAPVMYFLFQLLLTIRGKAPAWIRTVSMMVYVIHPAVIILIRGIGKTTGTSQILVANTLIHYLLVCILSFGFARITVFLLQRRKSSCINKDEPGLN